MKKFFLSCLMFLTCINQAFAWQVQLEDSKHMPFSIIVVDKGAQNLSYLEKHSPLSTLYSYPSIHGELEGDKEIEGDLKTPEGIYFITTKIHGTLDFEKYGSQAHALNYPNPVDRLRGKTGSGIWIHSKGQPIESQKTEGCIAIDLDDIAELGPFLKAGTPVMVAQAVLPNLNPNSINTITDVDGTPSTTEINATHLQAETNIPPVTAELNITSSVPQNNTTETIEIQNKLVELTKEWNRAWASRSNTFFDFYDTASYSKAHDAPFSKFHNQKVSLFNNLNWIYINHEEINVLQGPGYWVTWFKQYYRAPNHKTQGIRRLYWQVTESGEYKIIGMEWLFKQFEFENEFINHTMDTVPRFLETWKSAWKNADIENYATFYAANAQQDSTRTINEIIRQKKSIWQLRKPATLEFSNMIIDVRNDAIYVRIDQRYSDTSGYEDRGIKKLVLYPNGSSWLIAREQWHRR